MAPGMIETGAIIETQLWAVLVVLLASLLGGLGANFLKKGSEKFHLGTLIKKPWRMLKNYELVLGISLYALGTILFIPALKGGELSILYPIVSTSYVWTVIFSRFMIGERINWEKIIGAVLIVIGVSLLGLAA